MSLPSPPPTINHWAPPSLYYHHHRDNNNTWLCLQACPRVHNTSLRCTSMYCAVSECRCDRSHHPCSKGWTLCHAAHRPETQHRGPFCNATLLADHECGFARLFEMQYASPAVMDISEGPWSAMLYSVYICVVGCSAAGGIGVLMLLEQVYPRKEKLCVSAAAHGVVCSGISSSTGCTSSGTQHRGSFLQCSSSGRRCVNVASRSGLKYRAVMDNSEAAVSAMQRPCFDGVRNLSLFAVFVSLLLEIPNVFCVWAVRVATSRMHQRIPPFSGYVVLFCHGQCASCPPCADPRVRYALSESHSWKVERKVCGQLHLKFKKCLRPTANMCFERKMQRTLKRE